MRRASVTGNFTSTFLFLALWSLSPAGLPAAPAEEPELTAPRASVYDPLTGETLYKKAPLWAEPAAMGSTAKIVTIDVALEAVKQGAVALGDLITISDKAASQACNCFADPEEGHVLQGGDQMTLDDALYSVALSDGEPTVAVAEFIAEALTTGCESEPSDWDEAACWEQNFIDLMNEHVDQLGLENTHFETVHGGDAAGQYTTTDDLIALWEHAVAAHDKFLDYTGMRSHTTQVFHVWNHPGGSNWYYFEKYYDWYHPGVDGDKGGNSTDCDQCIVSQATRIGRSLIAATLQSTGDGPQNFYDAGKLFDYGFAQTFHPDYRGASDTWGSVKDHAITGISHHRAASAVVTPAGKLKVITWRIDLDENRIERIVKKFNPGFTTPEPPPEPPRFGLKVGGSSEPDGRAPGAAGGFEAPHLPPRPPRGIDFQLASGLIEEAKITYVGGGHLVVAVRTSLGAIELSSWGIPQNDPAFFRHKLAAGIGSELALQRLADGFFVSGHRDPDGRLVLQSWSLDLNSGVLYGPLSVSEGPKVQEFAMSGREHLFLDAHLLTVAKKEDGNLLAQSWSVNPGNGDIALKGSDAGGKASKISVTRVPGFGNFTDLYAAAMRLSGGDLKIIVYSFASNGELSRAGSKTAGAYTIGTQGGTAIAPFAQRGVLLSFKNQSASPSTDLTVWSLDVKRNGDIGVNFVAERTTIGLGLPRLAGVPDEEAEGDFLLQQLDVFNNELRVGGWRSGERP